MVEELSIKIDKKLLELLDKRRGDLPRDDFIELLLNENLNSHVDGPLDLNKLKKGVKGLINNENETITSDDLVKLLGDFQSFANNVYSRLDRLEEMIELNNFNNTKTKTDEYNLKLDEDAYDEDENVVFEVLDEPNSDVNSETFDTRDASSDYFEFVEGENSEFEYGCPFCNATIPENADQCPKCGNKFDDFESDDYMEVTPLSIGYDDSGKYDPRPDYLKRREGKYYPPPPKQMDKSYESPSPRPPEPKLRNQPPPLCDICGGKLSYVEDFKRWYCHRCKKYSGGPPPDIKPDSYSVSKVPRNVEVNPSVGVPVYTHNPSSDMGENFHPEPKPEPKTPRPTNIAHKRVHPKDKNWRPLKDYKKYE